MNILEALQSFENPHDDDDTKYIFIFMNIKNSEVTISKLITFEIT